MKKGDLAYCYHCGKEHPLNPVADLDGNESEWLMFVTCSNGENYIAAINGEPCFIKDKKPVFPKKEGE